MKKYALIGIIAILLLGVIVTGLWFAGSPRQARLERFDIERQNDIATLQNYLFGYWNTHGTVPPTLAAVTSTEPYVIIPVDPATQEPYEYIAVNSSTFSLCAVFDTEQTKGQSNPRYFGPGPFSEEFFRHGVGRTCFEKTFTEQIKIRE